MLHRIHRSSAAVLLLTCALVASAGEREDLESLRSTTLSLIKTLVEQGWITKEKADELIKQASRRSGPPAGMTEEKVADGKGGEKVVRVPYVPEMVKQQIRDEVKQEVLAQAKQERWGDPGALPEWIERTKIGGDLRFRMERDSFSSNNDPNLSDYWLIGQPVNNSTVDRTRARLRARLSVDTKISDATDAGMRIATCRQNDPLCIDASQETDGNRSEIRLDRAFIAFKPIENLRIDAGRFNNPFLSTDLVWNNNLGFDGIAGSYKYKWRDSVTPFVTGGIFPLKEIERSSNVLSPSKWLYGAQVGSEMRFTPQHSAKIGLAMYDFHNIEGRLNPFGDSLAYADSGLTFRQKGNTVFYIDSLNVGTPTNPDPRGTVNPSGQNWGLAAKFRVLNLTAIGDIAVYDPIHIMLYADYAKNIGFDMNEITARTGLPAFDARTKAWHLRTQVGNASVEKFGDWQAWLAYKYVEPDAVVDAFNDSDFRGGGTNAKGFILGANYGIDKNLWLSLRYFSAQQVTGSTQTFSGPPLSEDVLQFDLNARF